MFHFFFFKLNCVLPDNFIYELFNSTSLNIVAYSHLRICIQINPDWMKNEEKNSIGLNFLEGFIDSRCNILELHMTLFYLPNLF